MIMILLFKIDTLEDGTERFKTQLQIRKNVASFVREPNGIIKEYKHGNHGFDFYKYKGLYKIVNSLKELNFQEL